MSLVAKEICVATAPLAVLSQLNGIITALLHLNVPEQNVSETAPKLALAVCEANSTILHRH